MARRDDIIDLRDTVKGRKAPVAVASKAERIFRNDATLRDFTTGYTIDSVDAVLAFYAVSLPEWRIEEFHQKWSGKWYANLERKKDLAICTAVCESPARALLLASLNAMIAEATK